MAEFKLGLIIKRTKDGLEAARARGRNGGGRSLHQTGLYDSIGKSSSRVPKAGGDAAVSCLACAGIAGVYCTGFHMDVTPRPFVLSILLYIETSRVRIMCW